MRLASCGAVLVLSSAMAFPFDGRTPPGYSCCESHCTNFLPLAGGLLAQAIELDGLRCHRGLEARKAVVPGLDISGSDPRLQEQNLFRGGPGKPNRLGEDDRLLYPPMNHRTFDQTNGQVRQN